MDPVRRRNKSAARSRRPKGKAEYATAELLPKSVSVDLWQARQQLESPSLGDPEETRALSLPARRSRDPAAEIDTELLKAVWVYPTRGTKYRWRSQACLPPKIACWEEDEALLKCVRETHNGGSRSSISVPQQTEPTDWFDVDLLFLVISCFYMLATPSVSRCSSNIA